MNGCTMRPRRGEKAYEYRKDQCGAENYKPGTCRRYAVHEKVILDLLTDQLLNVYMAPERLEGLRRQLRELEASKKREAPEKVRKLRQRLERLDTEVRAAARNVLRAGDNFDLLNEHVTALRKQREKIARELSQAEAAQKAEPIAEEQAVARVGDAIARLYQLRERLEKAGRQELGEVLRLLISRVDLYFEPREKGKKRWFQFIKGAIKLRPILDVQGCASQLR
jgi:hypothetical protein